MALLIENGADVNSRNYCGQVRDLGISVSFGYFLSILLVVPLDWIIDTVIFLDQLGYCLVLVIYDVQRIKDGNLFG